MPAAIPRSWAYSTGVVAAGGTPTITLPGLNYVKHVLTAINAVFWGNPATVLVPNIVVQIGGITAITLGALDLSPAAAGDYNSANYSWQGELAIAASFSLAILFTASLPASTAGQLDIQGYDA